MILFVCHLYFGDFSQMYYVHQKAQCTYLENRRGAKTSYAMPFNLKDHDDLLRLRSTCQKDNCGTFEEGL